MPEGVEIQITASARGAEEEITRLRANLQGLQGDASNTSGTDRCRDSLDRMGEAGRMTARRLTDLTDHTRENERQSLRAARAHNMFMHTLGRITSMMILRTAIRSMMKATKEGIDNLYEWSKLHDKTFAKAMNQGATNVLYMKNSLATALAPAIIAIMPLLTRLADIVHMVSNAVAQFIAIITGQDSWTQATSAMAQYQSGITQTNKKIKELLADWDELNIIQSESGSDKDNGMPSIGSMFNTVELDGWKKKLADFFAYFKEPMEKILKHALAIGAAFLAWRIGSRLISELGVALLGTLGIYGAAMSVISIFDAWNKGFNLNNMIGMIGGAIVAVLALRVAFGSTIAGIVGLVLGLGIIVTGVHDQLVNGLSWESLIAQISGIGIAALGAGLLFGTMGIGVALLAGGITELVLGLKDFVEQGKLTSENSIQIAAGFGLIGAALALLTGAWIPLVVGALAGLVVAVAGNWEEIKAKWETFKTETIAPAVEWINTNIIEPIRKWFDDLAINVQTAANNAVSWFKSAWDTVISTKSWIKTSVVDPIGHWFSTLGSNIKTASDNAIQWFKDAWDGITEKKAWIKTNVTDPIGRWFSTLGSNVKTASDNAIKWFKESWDGITEKKGWIKTNVTDPVGRWFSTLATNVQTGSDNAVQWFKDAWDTATSVSDWLLLNIVSPISGWFSALATNISGAMSNAVQWFKDAWTGIGEWIDTNVTQPIADFFKGAINSVINTVNGLITQLNTLNFSIPSKTFSLGWPFNQTFTVGGWTIGFSNIPTIPTLASGGLIDSGQLFIANETGIPEMVGRIGNQSAVVNNDQIIQGIAEGVAEANGALESRLARLEDLMERFISKKFYAEVKPSTSLGRVVRQSEEMRLRTEGA